MSEQLSVQLRKGEEHFYAVVEPPISQDTLLFEQFRFRADAMQELKSSAQIYVFAEEQFCEKVHKTNGRSEHLFMKHMEWLIEQAEKEYESIDFDKEILPALQVDRLEHSAPEFLIAQN